MKEVLINSLKSGFTFMAIPTVETNRVVEMTRYYLNEWNNTLKDKKTQAPEILKSQGYSLKVWDSISGLEEIKVSDGSKVETTKGSQDLLVAFRNIEEDHENASNPACVYIFQNIHLHWDDPMNKPNILQAIINFSYPRRAHRHIIFVGPYGSLPLEIAQLFVVVDFNLPSKEEIIELTKKFDTTFSKKKVKVTDEQRENAAEAAAGMTHYEAENAFRFSIVSTEGTSFDTGIIQEKKAEAVKKMGFLEYMKTDIKLTSVGGMHNMMTSLEELTYIYKNRHKAKEYGIPMPKGWLITGISGTGKSLIAKAISNAFGVPLFNCNIGKVFGSLVGETEKNTAQLFKQIEAVSPAVILLD